MTYYQTILIAIDINADYDLIIQRAKAVASEHSLLCLTYVTLPNIYLQPYLYGASMEVFDDEPRRDLAKAQLLEIAQQYGIDEDKVKLLIGDPSDEIKDHANAIDADLIVMGTHGRSGIKLLMGSTATSVLHGVQQDVLAVRLPAE